MKGAYWDSELKWAQQAGEAAYPLYTRKAGTDVSYLACARYLLSDATRGAIYPQFASHNAQTVAAISDMAGDRNHEFQRLHGMGQELYDTILSEAGAKAVRIYALSVPIKIYCPTWCVACWKTVRTPRLYTSWSILKPYRVFSGSPTENPDRLQNPG